MIMSLKIQVIQEDVQIRYVKMRRDSFNSKSDGGGGFMEDIHLVPDIIGTHWKQVCKTNAGSNNTNTV